MARRVTPSVAPPSHRVGPYSWTFALDRDHPKSRQAENPRTITSRSHSSSLVGCTPRDDTIESSMAGGVAFLLSLRPVSARASDKCL